MPEKQQSACGDPNRCPEAGTLARIVAKTENLEIGQKELKETCSAVYAKINGIVGQILGNSESIARNTTRLEDVTRNRQRDLMIILAFLTPIIAGVIAALAKAFS